MENKVVKLLKEKGPIVNREPGNSMMPILASREPVILEPIDTLDNIKKDDIVFAKIHGRFYTHLVHGVDEKQGILLGNNHGHVQGWTKKVFAKAHLIPKEFQKTKEMTKQYLENWKIEHGYIKDNKEISN